MKMMESERIDAPAGSLTIVAFLASAPTVVLRGMLGASAQHALARWVILVWTGVPSREYAVKDTEKGHENEPD